MQRPRIKPVHNPVWTHDDRIRIGSMQFGIGAEIEASDKVAVWRMFELMDGTRDIDEIIAVLASERPDLHTDDLSDLIQALIDGGFVEDAGVEPPASLSPVDLERHARGANYFNWVDTQPRETRWEVQRRLKDSRVTILGLGGAGSAAATACVAAGVGAVHCVDFDFVEMSNLNRQFLYTESDVGMSKTARAVERLSALNSDIAISGEEAEVTSSSDVERLMSGCDLFLLCADKPDPLEILNWTNDAALRLGHPWVMSFYAGPMIVIGLQDPPETPCYRCLRHSAEVAGRIEGDGLRFLIPDLVVNAVIAPSAGVAGNFAALEAIYHLGGLQPQTRGRVFHQSLTTYDFMYFIEGPAWEDCPACHGASGVEGARAPGIVAR